MADKPATTELVYSERLKAMFADGSARPPRGRFADWRAKVGPRTGPITDAGTRALNEQRGDVV